MRRVLMMVGGALGLVAVLGGSQGAATVVATVAVQESTPAPTPSTFRPQGQGGPTVQVSPADPSAPPPPEVAAGVYANDLTGSEVFPSGVCPSGQALGENVGEGFKLTVRGKCLDSSEMADVAVIGRNIGAWDGDIALNVKVVVGAERAEIALHARSRDRRSIAVRLSPGSGEAALYKREMGTNTTLHSRTDLGELLDATAWNRLALRLRGGEAWVLLNDQPVLYATDVVDQGGSIGLQVIRAGNPDDRDEVSVVFGELTLSAVDESSPERAPTSATP